MAGLGPAIHALMAQARERTCLHSRDQVAGWHDAERAIDRTAAPRNKKGTQMSLIDDSLRAFAAGAALCCAVYGAFAQPGEISVTIDNFTFKPDAIRVPIGTKIVWENNDDIPHSIVETTGKFHSPALDTEDKFSFTFDKAGSYEYFCGLHPHMKGKVVVTPVNPSD
jgi:plastocyanin